MTQLEKGEAVLVIAMENRWQAPCFQDDTQLEQNDIGPVIVGLIVIGVVALAGIGYGGYCTASGGNFQFNMSIKQGVTMSCTR